MNKQYEQHEIGKCWPPLTPEEFSNLKATIKNNPGEKPPVILYEGKILDGYHWYKGSQELKTVVKFEEFQGPQDPTDFVANRHKGRRHLNPHAAAEVASKLAPLHRGAPLGNTNLAEGKLGEPKSKALINAFEQDAQPQPVTRKSHVNKTLEQVARSVGTNPSAIQNYRYIAAHGIPEIAAAAKTEKIALTRAAKLAHLPREEQLAALNQALESRPRTKKRSKPYRPKTQGRSSLSLLYRIAPAPLERRCEMLWHNILSLNIDMFNAQSERLVALRYLARSVAKAIELIESAQGNTISPEDLYVRTIS